MKMNAIQREQLLKVLEYATEQIESSSIPILVDDANIEDNNTLQILMMQNLKELVDSMPLEADSDAERQALISYCKSSDPNGCYTDTDNLLEMGRPASLEEMRECAKDLGYYDK